MSPYSNQSAEEILRTRLARGEIDEATYRGLAAALRASRPGRPWRPAWFWAGGIVAAVVLLAGVVGPMIVNEAMLGYVPGISPCNVPALSGTVVNVTLWDMMGGGMMNGGMMAGRMMAVSASPSSVPAGEVWSDDRRPSDRLRREGQRDRQPGRGVHLLRPGSRQRDRSGCHKLGNAAAAAWSL